jgi:hypothetical protein
MFWFFIDIYWSVGDTIWGVLHYYVEDISNNSLFSHMCVNDNQNSSSDANFKSYKTSRGSDIELEVTILVKIFEFYICLYGTALLTPSPKYNTCMWIKNEMTYKQTVFILNNESY